MRRRGATFLCRFAAADQKHPMGILTNLRSLQEDLFMGWPIFHHNTDQLSYQGPLPRDCPCTRPHRPMLGICGGTFNSSAAVFF